MLLSLFTQIMAPLYTSPIPSGPNRILFWVAGGCVPLPRRPVTAPLPFLEGSRFSSLYDRFLTPRIGGSCSSGVFSFGNWTLEGAVHFPPPMSVFLPPNHIESVFSPPCSFVYSYNTSLEDGNLPCFFLPSYNFPFPPARRKYPAVFLPRDTPPFCVDSFLRYL